ncbi:hypothetical protein Tco_1370394 [Tanacetum coccineum]
MLCSTKPHQGWNCNYRLSTTFKPKEPTFQVALNVLSLTPFYQVFLISGSVPAIYMHEFWLTICPNLPAQSLRSLFEEETLAFIRELGYPEDIKPNIEERAILFLEAKISVKKGPYSKVFDEPEYNDAFIKSEINSIQSKRKMCRYREAVMRGWLHRKQLDKARQAGIQVAFRGVISHTSCGCRYQD